MTCTLCPLQYLDRIGQLFFGVPPKQTSSYGGLLGEQGRGLPLHWALCWVLQGGRGVGGTGGVVAVASIGSTALVSSWSSSLHVPRQPIRACCSPGSKDLLGSLSIGHRIETKFFFLFFIVVKYITLSFSL